jgi:SWIM zinc finger
MKFYQETTVWDGNVPNHIYLLSTDKSKLYGYIKSGTQETQVFQKAIAFDQRGRKFREVAELGEIDLHNLEPQAEQSWEFTGSKGDRYIVQKTDNMLKCSCPGYTFRGDCKHIKLAKEQA